MMLGKDDRENEKNDVSMTRPFYKNSIYVIKQGIYLESFMNSLEIRTFCLFSLLYSKLYDKISRIHGIFLAKHFSYFTGYCCLHSAFDP